jgi:hypothetical protein
MLTGEGSPVKAQGGGAGAAQNPENHTPFLPVRIYGTVYRETPSRLEDVPEFLHLSRFPLLSERSRRQPGARVHFYY